MRCLSQFACREVSSFHFCKLPVHNYIRFSKWGVRNVGFL
jgi:hypothetical protein